MFAIVHVEMHVVIESTHKYHKTNAVLSNMCVKLFCGNGVMFAKIFFINIILLIPIKLQC